MVAGVGVGLYRRLSVPQRLEASAALVYGLVFVLLVEFGRPGLGLSQGFYLGIVLVALAGGPVTGAAAGALAAFLLAASQLVSHQATVHTVWNAGLEVRLVSYALAGTAVGYFAQRGRRMLGESLHLLDDLLGLARREVESGALTSGGFAARIGERAAREWPFAVLAGSVAAPSDRAVRAVAGALAGEDEVAQVGSRLGVVASASSAEAARARAVELEQALEDAGVKGTFGWAFHPADGTDGLALFGAACERLQARRTLSA